MGRWSYSNRWTVEESKSISMKWLKNNGYLSWDWSRGSLRWSRGGRETGSIGFELSLQDCYIRFMYTQTDRHTKEETKLDYKARLVSTPCNYGGVRWWFKCPLVGCGRKVTALYLGGKYFGCRHCYDLTYESCKENHKWDSLFKKLGVKETGKKGIKEAMEYF